MAPMRPGCGARVTLRPRNCSKARSTASLRKVPPCTTMRSPSASRLATRMTLVKTFSMIERQRPAMMSSGPLPRRCSETTLEFMKTVQRLPSAAGSVERNAAEAISSTATPRLAAKPSKKEPQPAEQASLTTISVRTPWSSQMAFMSCPPMSSTKVASGTHIAAARACATVSTVW